MSTTLELKQDGPVARVRIHDEKGIHLLTASARRELAEIVDALEQQPDLRVVVFEAEGRTFIAGADINELKSLSAATAEAFAREVQRLFNRIARLPAVSIAAVHAACAGGGCELALACDQRLAAESAVIGLPEVSLGLLPGWGGTVRAVRLFGGAVARRMILSGELLAAAKALELGIVDTIASDDEFRDAVDLRVEQLLSRGPAACGAVKRLIAELEGGNLDEQFEAEARAFTECYATAEPAEGLAAFLEKRPPVWP